MNSVTLRLAAVLSIVGLPALAQQPASAARPATELQTPADQLVGRQVYNNAGQNIGTIAEVLVDTRGGPPSLVLSVGKFLGVGEKYVVVPIGHVSFERQRVIMARATQEHLDSMEPFLFKRIERNEPN